MTAQDRFENQLQTKTLRDGRVVFIPNRLKSIDENIMDVHIIVDELDRADLIANNVFGSAAEWWRIVAINKSFKGSLFFKPGTEIVIPTTSK
jgi:hypothetical protein